MELTEITLTERQVECITYIEQVFALEGSIPTAGKVSEVFGITEATAKKWLSSEEFNIVLRGKGVIQDNTTGVLSAPQLQIINMLLNLTDRRSEREKCEAAGITPATLAAWRRDPGFIGYMQKRAEKMFKDSDDIAYLNVMKNMQSGDLQAAKFYFEMTGKYTPSVRLDVNVDSILAQVIEVLQVRVKDQDTLELIAGDLEAIMDGRRPNYAREAIPAFVSPEPSVPLEPSFPSLPVGDNVIGPGQGGS